MYTVAQKPLDMTLLLLKMENEVISATPCIIICSSSSGSFLFCSIVTLSQGCCIQFLDLIYYIFICFKIK